MPVAVMAGSPFAPAVAAALTGEATGDPTRGNRVAIVSGGNDALLLRVHLIRQARVSIDIQTFIWSDDECGRLMIYELIEAARRGVKVRVIADHMVSDQDPATVAFLATVHPNFQLKHYRPAMARIKPSRIQTMLAALWSFHDINQRMHNKVMIFDGAVLITGGRNIENTYFDRSSKMNFRDRDVLAIGPVAQAATASFEQFWKFRQAVPGTELKDVAAVIAQGKYPRYETRADYDFGPFFKEMEGAAPAVQGVAEKFAGRLCPVARVDFICDEPGKPNARIALALRQTAAQAQRSVVMQTPYLILSKPARRLVHELREKNPDLSIRISSNSFASTDNLFAYSANYRLRGLYMDELKLQIHEFKPRPDSLRTLFPDYDAIAAIAREKDAKASPPYLCVHAKSLVVDDRLAFIGSYNLDPRSENLNTEVGLVIEDAALARELREEIEADMRPENSWVIGHRVLPLGLGVLNSMIAGLISLSPVDVWPIQNTTSFELRAGAKAVPPDDSAFHKNYREVGSFPGTEGVFTQKEILTRLYKAVGSPLTPIM
ncbi:MAG: phospholipase D family protein [Opitutaceae bacterium]|nr:phospholipase D family protein [Opitutaceae bacterium]MBP9912436.1 phospholipase D family protein [Opitutaceae bacterium]